MIVSSLGDLTVHCVKLRDKRLNYSIAYKTEHVASVVVKSEGMVEVVYETATIEITKCISKEAKMACVNVYMALMHLVGTPRYLAKEGDLTGEALQDYRFKEALRIVFITHAHIIKPINAYIKQNNNAIASEVRKNKAVEENTRVFLVGTYSLEALSKCICRKAVTNIGAYVTPFMITLADEEMDTVARGVIYKKVLTNILKTIDKKEKEYIQFITDRRDVPNMSVDFLLGGAVSVRH